MSQSTRNGPPNLNSRDKKFLRKHGWQQEWMKPAGFRTDALWSHPVHGRHMQGGAVKLQRELNRKDPQ